MSELCKLSKKDACFVVESFVRTIDSASDSIVLKKNLKDFNYYSQLLEMYSQKIDSDLYNNVLKLKLGVNKSCAGSYSLNDNVVNGISGWYDNFLLSIHNYIIQLPEAEQKDYVNIVNLINEKSESIELGLSNLSTQVKNGFENIEKILQNKNYVLKPQFNPAPKVQRKVPISVNSKSIINQPESLENIIIDGKKYTLVKSEADCLKKLKNLKPNFKFQTSSPLIDINYINFDNSLNKIKSKIHAPQNHVFSIKFHYSNLTDLNFLNNLKYLFEMNLSCNDINCLNGINNFKHLNYLTLAYNNISKLDFLRNLHDLKTLSLAYNNISRIEGLDNLRNLKTLSLAYNNISRIEGLDNLRNLEELSLAFNNISRIEGLNKLGNLEILNLNENQIDEIQGLNNLKKLSNLFIADNNISNIDCLKKLNFNELSIYGNPLPKRVIKKHDKCWPFI